MGQAVGTRGFKIPERFSGFPYGYSTPPFGYAGGAFSFMILEQVGYLLIYHHVTSSVVAPTLG